MRDLWLDSNEMSDEQGSYDRISKYSGAKGICQPPVVQVVPIKKTRDCKRERSVIFRQNVKKINPGNHIVEFV